MRTYSRLAEILESRYGASPLAAPVVAIVWAADALADEVGITQARQELRALNRRRAAAGRVPTYSVVCPA